ncbi:hypothetical protein QTI24_13915 [Variovorax sp. J22P240]|uniref:hypothetical protein n=1 Tax=Variovorax sp. J22P240 TaxID=3053514 RepID=UPI00257500AF|nr:hypothetical protein [Variovorax sp. J22P240]MDL9999711.1 hypothetical protein [Variovorax sp. J22P240]
MPRWLAASFIAFVLSCFGFAAVAHGSTHSRDHGGASLTQVQLDLSASVDAPVDDTEDASALQDEANSGCTEAATGGVQAFLAVFASEPVPQPAMSATPSPFLAQPKRPPRDRAFIL